MKKTVTLTEEVVTCDYCGEGEDLRNRFFTSKCYSCSKDICSSHRVTLKTESYIRIDMCLAHLPSPLPKEIALGG